MTIRKKWMFSLLLPASLVLVGMGGYFFWESFSHSLQQARALSHAVSGQYGAMVEGYLDQKMAQVEVLGIYLQSIAGTDQANREKVNRVLNAFLQDNEDILAVWCAWEPDSFDGKDGEFRGLPGHDSTGRFIPYWYRDNGELFLEHLNDYLQPGPGDYYLLSLHSGEQRILEPYDYRITENMVKTITSLTVPIKKGGRIVGVVGVDFTLDDLVQITASVRILESGFGRLISHEGMMVAHPQQQQLGTPAVETQEDTAFFMDIFSKGKEYEGMVFSRFFGRDARKFFFPVRVRNTTTPWTFSTVVLESEIYATPLRELQVTLLIAGSGFFTLFLVLFFLVRSFSRRVTATAGYVNDAFSKGVFHVSLPPQELKAKDELGDLARRLEGMRLSVQEVFGKVESSSRQIERVSLDMSGVSSGEPLFSDQLPMNMDAQSLVTRLQETTRMILKMQEEIGERERQLHAEREKAEAANRAKTEFLQVVSHELRTPLNGILLGAQMASKMEDASERNNLIKIVIQSARRLLPIINGLLDVARIESGDFELEEKAFSLRAMLDTCCSPFRVEAQRKGLLLLLQVSPDVPELFLGDEGRLSQVLNNLLGNAIKYTSSGYIKVSVARRQAIDAKEESYLAISVEDTGSGFPEGMDHKLFERFARLDKKNSAIGGTGLGLTIARALVERMGGTISARNRKQGGSVFAFQVPVSQNTSLMEPQALATQVVKGGVILVTSDPFSGRLLEHFFRGQGMVLRKEPDVSRANDLLKQISPDILIVDRDILLDLPPAKVPTIVLQDRYSEEGRGAPLPEGYYLLDRPFTLEELQGILGKIQGRLR
ncbi:MAG TPA: ATP-binding protein [Thermotogota bacterium]|nr:ATP-binding protein [Thermotogota bacterium]